MKILTVVGARPQFIKAATVSRMIREHKGIREVIVHTGQHFDKSMSEVFFEQLDIPMPDYNLGIAGFSHGTMTGRMIEGIEEALLRERPDWVLVYGDTNSTLAGALAASKLHIPVAHVEAGLRSYNPVMPEEINRIITDRISTFLFCPSERAVENLKKEAFPFPTPSRPGQSIENVGDVMYDAVLFYRDIARDKVRLEQFGVEENQYALCTLHRQENTDDPVRLRGILRAVQKIADELPIVFPLHPRTKQKILEFGESLDHPQIHLTNPVPYLEMQRLEMSAHRILTDSGGMQKEAYFHGVPCITFRDETEWPETVEAGWNRLVGAKPEWGDFDLRTDQHKRGANRCYGSGISASCILCLLDQGIKN